MNINVTILYIVFCDLIYSPEILFVRLMHVDVSSYNFTDF